MGSTQGNDMGNRPLRYQPQPPRILQIRHHQRFLRKMLLACHRTKLVARRMSGSHLHHHRHHLLPSPSLVVSSPVGKIDECHVSLQINFCEIYILTFVKNSHPSLLFWWFPTPALLLGWLPSPTLLLWWLPAPT